MTYPLRFAVLLAVIVFSGSLVHDSTSAASACAGSHGAGTSVLCDGDRMAGEGSYIESPNRVFRFYISGGHAVVYDVSSPDGAVWQYELFSGQGDDPGGHAHAVEFEFFSFGHGLTVQRQDGAVLSFYYGAVDSTGYVSLDNDGCLRFYDADDAAAWAICR